MDTRFYWMKDRIEQGQYQVYWEPGGENLADYFTKHHSSAHNKIMRSQYVHNTHAPMIRYNAAVVLKHAPVLKHLNHAQHLYRKQPLSLRGRSEPERSSANLVT
jgi:hypothetical protein